MILIEVEILWVIFLAFKEQQQDLLDVPVLVLDLQAVQRDVAVHLGVNKGITLLYILALLGKM